MPAGQYDLRIEQGATFERMLTWTENDVPVPLTDMTARLHIRKAANAPDPPLLSLTTANGGITLNDPGEIIILITAAQTAAMAAAPGVYDLEIVAPTVPETVTRLLQGKVTVSAEVTR